jgi:DNA-binding MarR family transcriptional regulator
MEKRLFFLIHQVHRKIFKEANRLSEEDVGAPISQVAALLAIHRGAKKVNDVGGALKLNRAATSELIARMQSKGLVTKKRSDDDGRAQVVEATAVGSEMQNKALPVIGELNDRIKGEFSDEEMAVVGRFLERLMDEF